MPGGSLSYRKWLIYCIMFEKNEVPRNPKHKNWNTEQVPRLAKLREMLQRKIAMFFCCFTLCRILSSESLLGIIIIKSVIKYLLATERGTCLVPFFFFSENKGFGPNIEGINRCLNPAISLGQVSWGGSIPGREARRVLKLQATWHQNLKSCVHPSAKPYGVG